MDPKISDSLIQTDVDKVLSELAEQIDHFYQNSIIPTLFKNFSKCDDLVNKTKEAIPKDPL